MSSLPSPETKPDTVSSLIHHLDEILPRHRDMSVDDFLPLLGVQGFVFLLLILATLNIVIFMLPGLSILFGVPMVIVAVQMVLGQDAVALPAFVRARKIKSSVLHRGLHMASKMIARVESVVKPRLFFLTHPILFKMHALVALLLAFMVALPIPFVNIPPSLGMIFLSLGLMQRDGVFILLAYVFGLWSLSLYESLGRVAQGLVGG
ncbi:MAG: exopolysaccharide biosynthesis protein [Alphaproteobacteria bacterium]|nr:exopolysaccharide biosynthesis protein [Alphaproteobacteria bacterium]